MTELKTDLKRVLTDADLHNLQSMITKLKEDREHFWVSFKNNLHKHLRITNDAIAKIDSTIKTISGILGEKL